MERGRRNKESKKWGHIPSQEWVWSERWGSPWKCWKWKAAVRMEMGQGSWLCWQNQSDERKHTNHKPSHKDCNQTITEEHCEMQRNMSHSDTAWTLSRSVFTCLVALTNKNIELLPDKHYCPNFHVYINIQSKTGLCEELPSYTESISSQIKCPS